MENSDKTDETIPTSSIDADKLCDEHLYEFLNNMLNHINNLAEEVRCLSEKIIENGYERVNEILKELINFRETLSKIPKFQIEKSGDICELYNEVHFAMRYYIAHVYYLTVIHNTFYANKLPKIEGKYYINFKDSCNSLIKYLHDEILQNLSNETLEPNIKKTVHFNCYYMICDVILNLNTIKQKRKLKLSKNEIADLFSNFVILTNICHDDVTSGLIKKLLLRFFDLVNDDVWNKNMNKFNEETLKNIKEIRREWIKKESEGRYCKEGTEDLDKLVREIQGNGTKTMSHRNDQQKKVREKFKKTKKAVNTKNKRGGQSAENKTRPTETSDRFLDALETAVKQLRAHQNENGKKACRNSGVNTELTETEDSSLSPFKPFDVEEAKKFLQKRWEKAENDPNAVKLGELPSQSFTNK